MTSSRNSSGRKKSTANSKSEPHLSHKGSLSGGACADSADPADEREGGKRNCVSDRIKQVILDRICDGTYAPGQRLVELQIAKEFETSQAPIREALCELEAMRIVETAPYKGTRVRQISSRELQECLQIRGVLEQLAAEQVGDRLLDQIDELKRRADLTMAAAKEHNIQKYGVANIDFHRMIVEAAQNETLLMVWDILAPEIRILSCVHATSVDLLDCANEHMEIVDAFAEGDNRFAAKLLKKHSETVLTLKSPHLATT